MDWDGGGQRKLQWLKTPSLPPSLSLALSIDAAWRAGMDGDGGGQRGLEWLKNFDVFPKTVDDAKEVSVSGGSVSDANLI